MLNKYKNRQRLRFVAMLFILSLFTSTAFAATTGMLTFGGTVRITHLNISADELQMDFVHTSVREVSSGYTRVMANTYITVEGGRQLVSFDVHFEDASNDPYSLHARAEVYFQFQNTGTVPTRLLDFDMSSGGPFVDFQIQGGLGVGSVIAPGQTVEGFISVSLADVLAYQAEGDTSFNYWLALVYEQGQ